jgi:hypothetical protein
VRFQRNSSHSERSDLVEAIAVIRLAALQYGQSRGRERNSADGDRGPTEEHE